MGSSRRKEERRKAGLEARAAEVKARQVAELNRFNRKKSEASKRNSLSKMEVMPGPADKIIGFPDPSFGPAQANFYLGENSKYHYQNFEVISVDGPARFFIRNIAQTSAFMQMEIAMEDFYEGYRYPKMKQDDLVLGGFYVCYIDKPGLSWHWHRCRLEDFVENRGEMSLKVQLLDYGRSEIISDKIFPLHPKLLKLPCQVSVAKLHDNSDLGVEWTPADVKEFSALEGREIRGFVVSSQETPEELYSKTEMVIKNKLQVCGNEYFVYADRLVLRDLSKKSELSDFF